MNFEIIPNGLLHYIVFNFPSQQLFNLLLVNSRFYRIGKDEIFWLNKVKLDYNYTYKPADLTWKQFYLLLIRTLIRKIPLIYEES